MTLFGKCLNQFHSFHQFVSPCCEGKVCKKTKTEELISKYRVRSIKYPTFEKKIIIKTVLHENMSGLWRFKLVSVQRVSAVTAVASFSAVSSPGSSVCRGHEVYGGILWPWSRSQLLVSLDSQPGLGSHPVGPEIGSVGHCVSSVPRSCVSYACQCLHSLNSEGWMAGNWGGRMCVLEKRR